MVSKNILKQIAIRIEVVCSIGIGVSTSNEPTFTSTFEVALVALDNVVLSSIDVVFEIVFDCKAPV